MRSVRAFLRTSSQFVYVLALLVAVPSLGILAWSLIDTSRFLAGAVLGMSLGEYAAAAAAGTFTASAVAFLRPEDTAGWMLPFAGALLLAFAGLMVLLFVLPR